MESNFLIQRSIPKWGKNTYVNWNKKEVGKAVIFIHGFNGSSMATFGDFNLDFRYRYEFLEYDVYFFSYDSLYSQITNSALKFRTFLSAVNENINSIIKDSGVSITRNNYSKIFIVAHSLGAVVARQSLIDAYEKNEQWMDKCKLVLFAPAHQGARKELLDLINLHAYLKAIGPALKFFVVTLGQLIDKDVVINPMVIKYKELIAKGIISYTIAEKVIWADPERVVYNVQFLKDPVAIEFPGKHHTDVCKPTRSFSKPFDELAEILA